MTTSEEHSSCLLQSQAKSFMEGSFHSWDSFSGIGQGEQYDKTLFNICYLMQ